jgi:putative phosphoribosyl transferase
MGQIPDMSATRVRFRNRVLAARRLALCLVPYREKRPLVVGLPPGGTQVAGVIASELGGDLDVSLVQALVVPGTPPVSIGAVAETGIVFLQDGWESLTTRSVVRESIADARERLQHLRDSYTPKSARRNPAERLILLADDGLSAGPMLRAAILSLRNSGARSVIAASPVLTVETQEMLRREADVVICLRTLESLTSASSQYEELEPVPEREIREALRRASKKPFTRGAG